MYFVLDILWSGLAMQFVYAYLCISILLRQYCQALISACHVHSSLLFGSSDGRDAFFHYDYAYV